MTPGEHFAKMSERIARNPEEFGGAFVIVPPGLGGDPVARLVISSSDDASAAVTFWNVLQAEMTQAMERLKDKERQRSAFGR